jgi:kynureninase
MSVPTDIDYARTLDEQDELASFRHRFVVDDPSLVYLDGNSLGRLPKASLARAENLIRHEWGGRLIRAWNEHWFDLPERIGAKLARLLGAAPDEVIVADSTSVNLFKLVVAALRSRPGRTKVITDDLNFPSDLYILHAALELVGPDYRLHIVQSRDGVTVPPDLLAAAIDDDTALVALSHVAFKSGYLYDMAEITRSAHARDALVLWDVSHSVGAMPLDLAGAGVDLAVGCTYKYLSGGPGSPALLFVRRDLQRMLANPIVGWFGHRDQFAFLPAYEAAGGLRRFLTGTPPIVSLGLIEPGVDLLLEAGLDRIHAKSVRQTEYLIALHDALLAPLGFELNSPRDPSRRGSHVSFGHPDGLRVARALINQMRVIPDFRRPDNIRLGASPLCTSYAELHAAVTSLQGVVTRRLHEQYATSYAGVT